MLGNKQCAVLTWAHLPSGGQQLKTSVEGAAVIFMPLSQKEPIVDFITAFWYPEKVKQMLHFLLIHYVTCTSADDTEVKKLVVITRNLHVNALNVNHSKRQAVKIRSRLCLIFSKHTWRNSWTFNHAGRGGMAFECGASHPPHLSRAGGRRGALSGVRHWQVCQLDRWHTWYPDSCREVKWHPAGTLVTVLVAHWAGY